MKSLITTLLLTITLSSTVFGDDLNALKALIKKGDYPAVTELLKPLARQGEAWAQHELGYMYDNGYGVPKDDKQAVKWYRLAAEQGYAIAQYNLGNAYRTGTGVPQNAKKAMKWYLLAAEQVDTSAQYNLGLMYANGEDVPEDKVLAYMWWNLAAANGYENASTNKGIIAKRMTSAQIEKAQELSRDCLKNNYKDC
jgi:uncharacterized protein